MLRMFHIHRLNRWALFCCLVATAAHVSTGVSVANAQTPVKSDSMTLSLSAAVARAMQRNEDIGIARSQIRGAMAQRAQARSAFMPQITSQTSYARTLRGPLSNIGESAGSVEQLLDDLDARRNNYSNTLGASQLVFDRKALSNLRAAHEVEQVQELQYSERQLDVTLQIVEAYYGAVLADRVVEISDAALEEANRQLDHVTKTHKAGNASEMDVLTVEVQRDNLEPGRVDALNARDQALRNLQRLIDVKEEQSLRLTDSLRTEEFKPLATPAIDSLSNQYTRRASIAAADRNIRIQKLRESGARGSRLPSVLLGASFAKAGSWENGSPSNDDLRDNWSVSIAFQAPVFDGGARKSDAAAFHELSIQSQLQLDQMKKAVALEVAQRRGELDRAAASVQARSHTAALADRNYTLMALAYEKGVVNTLQLSDARLQLRQARVNEVQALHDYYIALARLRRAAGHSPYSIN